jgi:hypothetical protein
MEVRILALFRADDNVSVAAVSGRRYDAP